MSSRVNPVRLVAALLLALLVAVGLTGCGSDAGGGADSGAGAGSGTAAGSFGTLDAKGFQDAIAKDGVTVLDVRTPEEFAAGHLPGAVNIDVESPDFATKVGELAKDGEYAVYCRSGNRSAVALETMKELGFTTAYHLGGGIKAWQAAGGEVVPG